MITRRHFLSQCPLAGCAGATWPALARGLRIAPRVPIRAITHLPGHHWFGYYG